jgi:tetratricopeptide (TPR) repeat protein
MSGKVWGALALALLFLVGCGAPRSPYGKQVDKVENYSERGDEWYGKGDLPRASKDYNKALELSQGMDYQPGVARQLNNLGAVSLEQGDLARAREFFTRAWEINRDQGNWAEASTNQANLATVAQQAGNRGSAAQHLAQAEEVARLSKDKAALARLYCRWAGFYLGQMELSRTEEYLNLARPLARTPASKAAVAHQQGRLALARGDARTAIAHLIRALEEDRKLLDRAAIAADLYFLGEAFRLQQDWSQAFDYYARAFDVYAALGRRASLRDCLKRLKEANREGVLNRPLERFEKHTQAS